MTVRQLDPAIWSRVFGYLLELKTPTEFTERDEFGQHDLSTVCRVSSMFYDVAVPIDYRRIKTNNFASLLEGANEDYDEEDSDDEDTENEEFENEESEDDDSEDDDSENEDSEDDDSEDEDTRNEDTEDDETEDEAPDYSPQESLKNSDSKAS